MLLFANFLEFNNLIDNFNFLFLLQLMMAIISIEIRTIFDVYLFLVKR